MVVSEVVKDVYLDYEYREIRWYIFVKADCDCETKGTWMTKVSESTEIASTETRLIELATHHEYLHVIEAVIKASLEAPYNKLKVYKEFAGVYKKKDLDTILEWLDE